MSSLKALPDQYQFVPLNLKFIIHCMQTLCLPWKHGCKATLLNQTL